MEENKVTSTNQTLSDQELRERAELLADDIWIEKDATALRDAIFRELLSVREHVIKQCGALAQPSGNTPGKEK